MPFQPGDDVLIKLFPDTGVVRTKNGGNLFDVCRDADLTVAAHHKDGLTSLPYRGRISYSSFYYVVDAQVVNGDRYINQFTTLVSNRVFCAMR